LGEYLGITAARMGPDDAIYAGFADSYIPQLMWTDLIAELEKTGDVACLATQASAPPEGNLRVLQPQIDRLFAGGTYGGIMAALAAEPSEFAKASLRQMGRNAPLSMACTVEMMHRLRGPDLSLTAALELEYRFTARAMEHGDFLEGIRAAIIDKDRNPVWRFAGDLAGQDVPATAVAAMLAPLENSVLDLSGRRT